MRLDLRRVGIVFFGGQGVGGMFSYSGMEPTDLEGAVREALEAGRQAWPDVELTEAQFAGWVGERAIAAEALRARGADLYLACACALGADRALLLFDRTFLHSLRPTIARSALGPEQLDELRQRLRVRLLTGPNPRIGTFQGQGPLGAWVRVAAARLALEVSAGARDAAESDGALIDALVNAGVDPELSAAKRQFQAEFRAALEQSLATLEAREKTLLRMHFLDHLNIDEMGTVFRVHRATIARWLVAIRRQVFDRVCEKLSLELRSSPSEVASLVRLVRSEVEVSILRLLKD
jgi:RNA polymerase sigma-70 factor (ECF subfamily)